MSDIPIESGPSANELPTQDSPNRSPPSPSKIPVLKLPKDSPEGSPKESPKRAAINGTWPYPDDTSTARQGRRDGLSTTTTGINRRRLQVTASTFSAPENSASTSRPPPWAEGRVTPSGRSSLGPKEPDTPTRSPGRRATLPLSGRVTPPSTADASMADAEIPTLAAQVAALVATYEGRQAAELAAVRRERDDLIARVASLEADLECARTDTAAANTQVATLTAKFATLTAEVATLTAKVATLTAKVAAREAPPVAARDVQNALAALAAVREGDGGLTDRVAFLEAARNALPNRVVSPAAVPESGHPALATNEQDDVAATASVADTVPDTAAKLEAHVNKFNVSLDFIITIVKGLKRCSDYATECAQRATASAQRAEERAIRAEERIQRAEERIRRAEERTIRVEEHIQRAEQIQRAEERTIRAEEHIQRAEERIQRAEERAQRAEEKVNEDARKIAQMHEGLRGLEEVNKELVIAVTKLGDNGGETE